MTVVEHLTELRRRIMISLVAVIAFAVVAYVFAPDVIRELLDFYIDAAPKGTKHYFIFTGPVDAFVTRLRVATYGGILLAVPVWLWQLWRFITPGLHVREKRYAVPFVLTSVLLFVLGGVVALITLPQALDFLLSAGGEDLQPLLTADKYISLVTLMILAFGLAFEFPVILVFLLIARVLSVQRLVKWRRWAVVLIFAFAAVITPSQDPYSLFFMALPMYFFYEGSILIGKALKR
ncbi:MAG: twin-arginine translocase subunit TatC [Acidimicrobiia bacterium]